MPLERKLLVFTTAALSGLGILMVYSSSITPKPTFVDQKYLLRQLTFLFVGAVMAFTVSGSPISFWRRAARPLMVVTLLLLAAVLIPGVGTEVNGARRWIRLGPVGFQPSELAKICIVLYLARSIEAKDERIRRSWKGWLPEMLVAGLVSALVLLEPDFGTAVLLLCIPVVLLFVCGARCRDLAVLLAGTLPIITACVLMHPYRLNRIRQFIQAWTDLSSAPYQIQQSLLAVGSGAWWGTGLGAGWQKLGFLPEANTDFVFAVIVEELGLIGAVMVLALWGVFLLCGIRLAMSVVHDTFAYVASFGLIVQIFIQTLINIGVVTASLPPKGISLPLISYGGSSMVTSLTCVGLVFAMTRLNEGHERDGVSNSRESGKLHESFELNLGG